MLHKHRNHKLLPEPLGEVSPNTDSLCSSSQGSAEWLWVQRVNAIALQINKKLFSTVGISHCIMENEKLRPRVCLPTYKCLLIWMQRPTKTYNIVLFHTNIHSLLQLTKWLRPLQLLCDFLLILMSSQESDCSWWHVHMHQMKIPHGTAAWPLTSTTAWRAVFVTQRAE